MCPLFPSPFASNWIRDHREEGRAQGPGIKENSLVTLSFSWVHFIWQNPVCLESSTRWYRHVWDRFKKIRNNKKQTKMSLKTGGFYVEHSQRSCWMKLNYRQTQPMHHIVVVFEFKCKVHLSSKKWYFAYCRLHCWKLHICLLKEQSFSALTLNLNLKRVTFSMICDIASTAV